MTMLLILLLTTSGCDETLQVSVDGNNPPSFRFSTNLTWFQVEDTESKRIVWKVKSSSSKATAFTYGKLPDGCSEDTPAETLIDGKSYTIFALAVNPHINPAVLQFTAGKPAQNQ